MKYRVTCLTPLLIGDGQKLAPIEYMVWKDQVNVLDQRRIFRLLAKGPRLDNYLAQLKRADKLDFASWGGFAQNFAGRRIPFENPASTACWERARADSLHIPTFVSGPDGPYIPGTALKGALRTGMLFASLKNGNLDQVAAQFRGDRPPRRPAEAVEDSKLGAAGGNRMRVFRASDSTPGPAAAMRIYLLRVATLQLRGRDQFELGWKQSPRGTADGKRPEDGTPFFAEMAPPDTVFEGTWQESSYLAQPEIWRSLKWREPVSRERILQAANEYASEQLRNHQQFAEWSRLPLLAQSLDRLRARLAEVHESGNACLLSLGWGGGLLSKVAWLKTQDETYRDVIRQTPAYGRSIPPALPFPKTRRVVFLENRPATLPGWVLLELIG